MRNDLSAARGILAGLALGILLWAVIALSYLTISAGWPWTLYLLVAVILFASLASRLAQGKDGP